MKSFSLFILVLFCTLSAFAQIPDDALKYSWYGPNGTARTQAIGGAIGALGADISSNYVNPAGLAFFKTREFVLSPGYNFLKSNSSYRGGDTKEESKNAFSLGTTGFVFGSNDNRSRWNGSAFSIAVSKTANFNSRISYAGQNNFSSYGEQYAAEASHIPINEILGSNRASVATQLAFYTYLIDTLTVPSQPAAGPQFVSLALWNNLHSGAPYLVNQQHTIETKGGITEIAIGYAATHMDKFYLGGSLGIPIVNYEKTTVFTETDALADANSNFKQSTLTEKTSSKGVGLNLKLGAIYKVADQFRLGLAVHTPTIYGLKDTYWGSMTTNTENYVHPNNSIITASSDTTLHYNPEYKYDLTSPWRVMLSAAYVINSVEDVKQQKGFISADIEYVTYRSNSYHTAEDGADDTYYTGVNSGIKSFYKNAFNFRVGGEMKFTTFMARLGFSYYMDPYKESEVKGNKMNISGGLGYRNKGFFVDLTYVYNVTKDVNFPYHLPDKSNTFALVKGTGSNIAATVGMKF